MISKNNIVPLVNWHKVTVRSSGCISRRTSGDWWPREERISRRKAWFKLPNSRQVREGHALFLPRSMLVYNTFLSLMSLNKFMKCLLMMAMILHSHFRLKVWF